MTIKFLPASSFNDRHGLFVALVGGTNSGKSFSALRLARGIAGPKGRIAAADTEGGRLLHLKRDFDFDILLMDPPHHPAQYAEVAEAAEVAGYDALLIDSFSMEWRGVGGVLDQMDSELERAVRRAEAKAREKGWNFDEDRARNANKMAASIKPKMAHKLMVNSLLARRIPIIFSIRGEMTLDPDTKKEKFKAATAPGFLFEVTVSFRLASDRRGIIDLSDPTSYKMEGIHRGMFRDGDQLSEEHGAKLAAWARGEIHGQPSAGAGPDLAAQVFEEAAAAARQGRDAFTAWWNGPGKEAAPGTETSKRVLATPRRPELQAMVEAAENPAGTAANDDDFPGTMPARAEG
ncbi:hypothetical protein [Azospirillum himalayense]|uniref:AAA domain-containing protein n=1 Tax=Azospirillum himalayense TaxID=654847 RepID=A0ABW0G8A2_9PROT